MVDLMKAAITTRSINAIVGPSAVRGGARKAAKQLVESQIRGCARNHNDDGYLYKIPN
jgi:hypothetical protein